MTEDLLGSGLANAFLAGEWEPAAMTSRGQQAIGEPRIWVHNLALVAWHAYPSAPRDRPRELAAFLSVCPSLTRAVSRARRSSRPVPRVKHWQFSPTAMGEKPWEVATVDTVGDLGELLGLSRSELMWFADPERMGRRNLEERLSHYRYRWVPKANGGLRLIEEPKAMLKHFQRVLLREILDHVPPHSAAHGFRTNHSALTYASEHVGCALIIHVDLEDFFGSVVAGRVFGIFRHCGYPEPVAHLLTGIVTNSLPGRVWATAPRPNDRDLMAAHRRLGRDLARPHLPQGAPTSPALANLAAFGLDRRLAGLAVTAGLTYSRYADDLALSSSRRRSSIEVANLVDLVTEIAAEEGFRVNALKTSIRRAGQRQRLAGIVVNVRPNVDRRDYDSLKAILNNAARHGPLSQNRQDHPQFRAHLLGRIAWMNQLNPRRGERLRAAFGRIDWDQGGE
jgi:RNA-directed DNA polymerase